MIAMQINFSLLLLIAVSWLYSASSQHPSAVPLVSVSREPGRKVLVPRGGRVDLRPAIDFNLESLPQDVDCKVTNIISSCGNVVQNVFDCRNYTGPILYQHYGCFQRKELATFMISISPLGYSLGEEPTLQPAQANILSVEVIVGPPNPTLTALRVDTQALQNLSLELTVVFPPSIVGHYHYEVVNKSSVLSLPMAGALMGSVNQLLPTGYIRNASLTYLPNNASPYTDYIMIRLYLRNDSQSSMYVILPFETILAEAVQQNVVVQLERDDMIIHQAINTPVSKSDFRSFNLSLNLASHGSSQQSSILPLPLVYYNFPILKSGAFRSLYSTSTNVSYTIFTSHDLFAGHVAFHPTDTLSSTEPTLYRYKVTNTAGKLIARGEINVLVRERLWEQAPQRKNLPLAVLEGGMAAINNLTIDFYTTYDCGGQAILRVLRPPEHGELVYENGSRIEGEGILLWVMRNTTLVRYKQLGGEELGDVIYWGIKCPTGAELSVFMSVLVVPVDDAPPALTIISKLETFEDWAVPLSPSSLLVRDPDSPRRNIHFKVLHLEGTLLRMFDSITELTYTSVLFPLMSLENVISSITSVQLREVLEFSIVDLEQQRIWYFPFEGLKTDSIEFTVTDSINQAVNIATLHVAVSQQPPNQTLVLSTPMQYPYVLKNKPLPLIKEGHMFLTSHFLYSQAPPSPPDNLQYVVTSPPQYGVLCSLSSSHCTASISSFTQQEINYHKIIYRPNNKDLHPDHFHFVVTVQGVRHMSATSHTFNWTVEEHTVVSKRQFWLNSGSEKRIAAKFFRTFTSLLQTRNVTFQVVKPPKYGHLLLGNNSHYYSSRPTSFTFDDLVEKVVWYNHTQHGTPPLCGDNLVFDATSPWQVVRGELPILFRMGRADLSVLIYPHVLMGLPHFTFSSKDFNVSSSFCPEFVTFSVDEVPVQGQLTLKDSVHNTERQLMNGSTFTAKDIHLNALSYRYSLSEHMPTSNVSDRFNVSASDPVSAWPPEHRNLDLGYVVVIIVPSLNEEYLLEVNFSSGHPLSWLPNQQSYGYALTSSDIDLLNSTLQPSEVVVQVESGLMLGNLARSDTPISFFTMADLQAGDVVYVKNSLILDRVFHDEVVFGMYAFLPGFYQRAALHRFVLEWALVGLEKSAVTVSEQQHTVQVTIKRRGATWFESRVIVVTMSDSASSPENCSLLLVTSDLSLQGAADFCHIRQEVVFPVGVVLQQVTVQLLDDEVAEGEESFFVQLLEEEGLTNAVLHGNIRSKVTITDVEDYNSVSMLGQPGHTLGCDLETDIEEFSRHLIVNLTRMGKLDQEVGVICYTEDHSAIGNADYLARLKDNSESGIVFGVNQSMAECVVTIVDDGEIEHREMFYVHLSPLATEGLVHVDPNYSTMCVYINHDDNDYPIVTFSETEVFVKESETEKKYVSFNLNRREPNLNTTTEVKYIYLPKDEDTAEENGDFRLFTSDVCILEGDPTPGGCVSFLSGQITAGLIVEILPDTRLEGNETFHLKIAYARNGTRSKDLSLSTLKVTIIDAAQPSYIELACTSIRVMESTRVNHIEVRRRGNLLGTTKVNCILKGRNATGGLDADADFIVLPSPEEAIFRPGDNQTFCILYVSSDMRYEGLESLVLTLKLVGNDPGVILTPNLDRAIIHITDHEDIPIVEFSSASHEVPEPLSNSTLDLSPLMLEVQRFGDNSTISAVSYTTVDQSAKRGRDYVPTSGVIVFAEGHTSAKILITVLANHDRDEDAMFTVQLSLATTLTYDPVIIGGNSTVTVLIRNLWLLGAYFSTLPQLDNVEEDGERANTAGLYYDLPLTCITACDLASNSSEDTLSDCKRQGIDNHLTVYSWEISTNGAVEFYPLNSVSAFTSPQLQVLQPAYLHPGLHVRCLAQAVDSTGVRGYSRTSEPVELRMEHYGCYQQESRKEFQGKLSSYKSFMAADKDIVRVELTVPAVRNRIPLLSLSTIFPDVTNATQTCSNVHHIPGYSLLTYSMMVTENDMSQLHFDPLYSHLNLSSCQWQFSAWYSVQTLVNSCGGQRQTPELLSVTAISTYQQLEAERAIMVDQNQTTATLSILTNPSPISCLPPPLHILPLTSRDHLPYLFPLSINQEVRNGALKVLFYLVTPADHQLMPSNQSVQLLYMNAAHTTQVWQLELAAGLEPVFLRFTHHDEGSCTECEQGYLFHLPLGPPMVGNDRSEVPTLLLNVSAVLLHETVYIGDHVNLTLKLGFDQLLQGEESLQVQDMYLCDDNCFNRHSIMGVWGSGPNVYVNNNSAESISVAFSTDGIKLVQSSSQWFLHIQLGLSMSRLYQASTTLPLVLLFPTAPDVAVTALPVEPEPTTHLYVIIGVLALVVFFVVTIVGVVIGLVCMNHGKTKFYRKASLLRKGSGKEFGEKLNSVRHSSRNSYQYPSSMKRTNSTIGFPTQEHRLKSGRDTTAKSSRIQRRGRPTSPKRLQRSQSLPSFPSPHDLGRSVPPFLSHEPAVVRKINCHGVRVHFKRVNVESSALNLWNSQQLMRNKELANLHIVQDLAIRYKHYGVNEIQPGHRPRAGHSTGPYAKYVVTTLAASAKTPEPGAKPTTKL